MFLDKIQILIKEMPEYIQKMAKREFIEFLIINLNKDIEESKEDAWITKFIHLLKNGFY